MQPIAERIMELPTHSMAGLQAKALVAMYGNIHLWDEDEVDDYGDRTVRALIDAFDGPIPEMIEQMKASQAAALADAEARS
jgi:hypothetical protein